MFRSLRHGHRIGWGEMTGIGIDEKLQKSKSVLEKATVHLQSIFDLIKNPKM
jgi:hypothetical protein